VASNGFVSDIKPYFTACYRAHMIHFAELDLWSADQVRDSWQAIRDAVATGSMPREGCGEGVWDSLTRNQFLRDLDAWKNEGFSS
jgi:hypothetical protein